MILYFHFIILHFFYLIDTCKKALVSGTEFNVTTEKITVSSKWGRNDNLDDARLNKKQGRYQSYIKISIKIIL